MCLLLNSICSCATLLTGYFPVLCEESTSSLSEPLEEVLYSGLCLVLIPKIWDHHSTASLWISTLFAGSQS